MITSVTRISTYEFGGDTNMHTIEWSCINKYKYTFREAARAPTFLHYPSEVPERQFTQGLGQASFLTQGFMTQLAHPSCSGNPTGNRQCQDSGLYLTRKLSEGSVPGPPGAHTVPCISLSQHFLQLVIIAWLYTCEYGLLSVSRTELSAFCPPPNSQGSASLPHSFPGPTRPVPRPH